MYTLVLTICVNLFVAKIQLFNRMRVQYLTFSVVLFVLLFSS